MIPAGNLNHDGQLDASDIDLLFANLGSGDSSFGVNHDGDVDMHDVDHFVLSVMGTRYGDVDLDMDVDIYDFNLLVRKFDPFGRDPAWGWGAGDFDGDGDVDIIDVNKIVVNFAPLGYASVPMEGLARIHRRIFSEKFIAPTIIPALGQSHREVGW